MPIYQAAGSIVLHFGQGDILVSTARTADAVQTHDNELAFCRHEPQSIGQSTDELVGKTTEEVETPVRMLFENVESLDVVVLMLQRLRGSMVVAEPAAV